MLQQNEEEAKKEKHQQGEEHRHGKHLDQVGAGLQKAPETMPPEGRGGGGTDIFRPVGVVDGHKTEVLEHVE